jgi:2-hydroxy-3-oxopropionate reductase
MRFTDFTTGDAGIPPPLKLGIVGLGPLGALLAGRFARAGHLVFVHTYGRFPDQLMGIRATFCTRPRGVAERADIIFVAEPEAWPGDTGVMAGLSAGKTVICVGEPDARGARGGMAEGGTAEALRALGCDCLDLRMPRGEDGLATLASYAVGGPQPAWQRLRPLFERRLGVSTLHS